MPANIEKPNILLQRVRAGLKVSQTKFAKLMKTSQPFVSSLERGERPISLERFFKICKVTGVSFWIRKEGISLLTVKETEKLNKALNKVQQKPLGVVGKNDKILKNTKKVLSEYKRKKKIEEAKKKAAEKKKPKRRRRIER